MIVTGVRAGRVDGFKIVYWLTVNNGKWLMANG